MGCLRCLVHSVWRDLFARSVHGAYLYARTLYSRLRWVDSCLPIPMPVYAVSGGCTDFIPSCWLGHTSGELLFCAMAMQTFLWYALCCSRRGASMFPLPCTYGTSHLVWSPLPHGETLYPSAPTAFVVRCTALVHGYTVAVSWYSCERNFDTSLLLAVWLPWGLVLVSGGGFVVAPAIIYSFPR